MSLTLHFHPLASYGQKVLIAPYQNDTPFTPNTGDYLRNKSACCVGIVKSGSSYR
jgi:hypothetical protein